MAEQIGEVTILHGAATAEGPDGIRELTLGSPIYNEDVVITDTKGAVEIQFTDGALLSQGPNSKVHLDEYVFDPDTDAGEMTMDLIEGTFRSVTGKIVDMNPEGFELNSPLATIGIRGTTTGHVIGGNGQEQHVVVDFVDKPVVIRPAGGGAPRIITQDGLGVLASSGGLGPVRPAPASILSNLQQLSSESMQRSAPEMEETPDDEPDEEENTGDNGEGQGEGQEPEGDQPEGGEGEGPDGQEPGGDLPSGPTPNGLPQPIPVQPPLPPTVTPPPPPPPVVTPPPPPPPPEDDTPPVEDDDPVIAPVTLLDLSDKTDPYTVNLVGGSPPYYEITNDTNSRIDISDSVYKVIGSATASNNITGDEQNNILTGGAAMDMITGGSGNDLIFGTGGGDDLAGGVGIDMVSYISMTVGVDVNISGSGSYSIDSIGYTDTLSGFEGVSGSNFADTIYGDSGDNGLWGNDGNDFIWGNGGADSLFGGAGNDNFKFIANADAGTTIDGGDGSDAIFLENSADLSNLSSATSIEKFYFNASGKTLTIEARDFSGFSTGASGYSVDSASTGGVETITINAANLNETIDISSLTFGANWESGDKVILNGYTGNDSIVGSAARDSISGGDGNDTLYGGDENDTILGGAGIDGIQGGAGADYLSGGDGDDHIDASFGNDTILGDAGNDNLWGGPGDDSIVGGDGADTILGSTGVDAIDGGTDASIDRLSYISDNTVGVTANLAGTVTYTGKGGTDTFTNIEEFEGSNYADTITTDTTKAYKIYARDGNDTVTYKGQADTIDLGIGDDIFILEASVASGTSVDACSGSSDMLQASNGAILNAKLLTLSSFELLDIGGSTTELLMGMAQVSGNAWTVTSAAGTKWALSAGVGGETADLSSMNLTGLNGNLVVTGNSGADILKMGTSMSTKVTYDGGSIGLDTLEYTDNGAGTDELNNVTNVETIKLGDATTSVVAQNTLVAGSAVLIVDGSSLTSSHSLTWDGSAEVDGAFNISGGCGSDQIIGSALDDTLTGNSGNDNLFGGNGSDYIFGGIGTDDLHGDAGNDTFYYLNTGDAGDLIIGFTKTDDDFHFKLGNFNDASELSLGINANSFKEIDGNYANYLTDGTTGIDADDHFVYYDNGSTFQLYYDANGSTAGGHTLMASFDVDPNVDANDILMVA